MSDNEHRNGTALRCIPSSFDVFFILLSILKSSNHVTTRYTNVLKIKLKCPEKYIKAYIFYIIQWIEFKIGNIIDISIYLKNILIKMSKQFPRWT